MPGRGIMKIEPSDPRRRPLDIDWSTQPEPAPAVLKIAHVEDEATGNAHDRFRAPTVLGGTVEFDVPHERSESAKQVLAEGRKKGAALATADLPEIEDAIAAPPEHHIRHAPRNGWYGLQRRAFVRQTGVVGRVGGLRCLQPPRPKDGEPVLITFRKAGTVQGWIDEVAMPARFSSRAILVIAATFAAPLLRILRFPSFGFNLFGANKSGKSTITTVAGSIIGLPNEAALPNLNTTTAGLLQLAGCSTTVPSRSTRWRCSGPRPTSSWGRRSTRWARAGTVRAPGAGVVDDAPGTEVHLRCGIGEAAPAGYGAVSRERSVRDRRQGVHDRFRPRCWGGS